MTNLTDKKSLGKKGEILAREYLEKLGFNIVDHNFRSRYGEIDLIVRKEKAFRFVEVKFRRSLNYGLHHESVIKNKQERIKRAALYWLRLRHLPLDTEVHFDVLGICQHSSQNVEYEYLEDAF